MKLSTIYRRAAKSSAGDASERQRVRVLFLLFASLEARREGR